MCVKSASPSESWVFFVFEQYSCNYPTPQPVCVLFDSKVNSPSDGFEITQTCRGCCFCLTRICLSKLFNSVWLSGIYYMLGC